MSTQGDLVPRPKHPSATMRFMKLPRWLMIGLWTSIVLAVLAAAGWWWVTWPERTGIRFVELISAQNLPEANKMLHKHKSRSRLGHQVGDLEHWKKMQLQTCPRTLADVCLGRNTLQMVNGNFRLTAERTGVILPDDEYFVWIGPDEWISLQSDGIAFVDSDSIAHRPRE